MSITLVPIHAILHATYGRYFRHGEGGIASAVAFSRRLLPVAITWSLVAGIGLWFVAPVAPIIVGKEFNDTVNVVRWLAPIPLLATIQVFGAGSLTGAGYQGARSMIQIFTALINIALNVVLIPVYGWHGAAVATLASTTILLLGTWGVVARLAMTERQELAARRNVV
jgi:O-antigen/teichoic acid export membrane protein